MTSELSKHKRRVDSVEHFVIDGLGYCCEHFFWTCYADLPAPLIAARLGVRDDIVRRHKMWFRRGKFNCTKAERCLPPLLKEKLDV